MATHSPLHSTRVEDYLNDKLQTAADLESLDNLLASVRNQQELLRQQLRETEQQCSVSTKASESHRLALLQQARSFKKQQADVDRRLLIVTRSETSDDAIEEFDTDIKILQRLDVARGYVKLLEEVEKLSAEARHNFKSSPQAALQPYLRLQRLAIALKEAQPAAEDGAPHLVDHVHRSAHVLWTQMKDAFAGDFEKVLAKMNWPGKSSLAGALEQEWNQGVERLLELQEPYDFFTRLASKETLIHAFPNPRVHDLLIESLHRELNAQNDHVKPYEEPLVLLPLKPILRKRFKNSNLAMTSIFIDSTSALITALLPMLRRKIFGVIAQIAKQPQLLSHFVHELMGFDTSLRDEWGYDGGCGIDGWNGLTWEVLVKRDWFGRWLEVEKDFALSRYQSIIDTPESGEIDYESVEPSATKPTNAAIRVNDLLETITDRYRPFPSFVPKLRFLIDIQLAIFDLYHVRLNDALQAHINNSTTLGRVIQGVPRDSESQTPSLTGLAGLERLVRIYGSAEYLEKKMRDWSDDVFFLELYEELQDRIRANTEGPQKNLGGNMKVEFVANKTSAAVLGAQEEESSGALFDETAGFYRRLRVSTENALTNAFVQQVRDSLKPYGKINAWSTLLSPAAGDESSMALSSSAELDGPISLLHSYLSFLAGVLGQAPLRRIVRQIMLSVQSFLWEHVLMLYSFSETGVRQFQRDVQSVCETVDRCVGAGQAEMGMRRLREGLLLLGLKNGSQEGGGMTLVDVERELFRDNESGRAVLEELGLEVLGVIEARAIVKRRIDLGS
ncbi:MAG: hypothetical protein Q9220_007038 [cf. Caloplaca sp. 1 TL-2023]